jgi:hypothetical protein
MHFYKSALMFFLLVRQIIFFSSHFSINHFPELSGNFPATFGTCEFKDFVSDDDEIPSVVYQTFLPSVSEPKTERKKKYMCR